MMLTKQSVKRNLQQWTSALRSKKQVGNSIQGICDHNDDNGEFVLLHNEVQRSAHVFVNHDDDDDDIASTEVESTSSSEGQEQEDHEEDDEEDQQKQEDTQEAPAATASKNEARRRFRVHFNLHLNNFVESETTIDDATSRKLWWRRTDYKEFQYNCYVVASKAAQTTVGPALLHNLYTTMSISSTPPDQDNNSTWRKDKKENSSVDEDKQQEEAQHHHNDKDYCEKILNHYTSTHVERDDLLQLCRSEACGRGIESYLYPNIVQERRAHIRSILKTQRLLKLESCVVNNSRTITTTTATTSSSSSSWKKTKNMMMSLKRSTTTSTRSRRRQQLEDYKYKKLMRNIIMQEHLATVSQNLSYRSKQLAIIMGSVDAIIARELQQQ